MTLTNEQLAVIDRHLRKENWLLNEDLIAELTDHYANGIEERLATGIPFELAMLDIHKGFGGRKGLLDMEEKYVDEANRTSFRAYWKQLKTYFLWPKILVPIAIIYFFIQVSNSPDVVHNLSVAAYVIHGIRTVCVMYFLFRLNGWGKNNKHPLAKKLVSFPGIQSAYLLYYVLINTENPTIQCVCLGVWLMELICSLEFLFEDHNFRKLLRLR